MYVLREPVVQWTLTVVFIATSGCLGARLFRRPRELASSISLVLHLAMSVDMALMWWSLWYSISVTPQLAIFACGVAFYTGRLLRSYRARGLTRDIADQAAHIAMMLAMIWMVLVMSFTEIEATSSSAHHGAVSGVRAYVGIVVTAALLVIGVVSWVNSRARRPPIRSAGPASFVDGAMSIAMAAMGWLMITT